MRIDWLARIRFRCRKTRRRRTLAVPVQRLEDRALLAAFVVDSTNDTSDADLTDGVALDAAGHVTLRAAIQQANALSGGDTITLPAGTYSLTQYGSGENLGATGDLDILDGVTLTGAGADSTFINGGSQDRLFDVVAGVTAKLSKITITGGTAGISQEDGGGIRNSGMLTLADVVLTNNTAAGGGGAIASYGVGSTLTITDSTLVTNSSNGPLGGGAIFNSSLTTITRGVLKNNSSSFNGGAIANSASGSLTLLQSTVKTNGVGLGAKGGGIYNNGVLAANYTTISGNTASDGGGVANVNFSGTTSFTTLLTTISGNSATNRGGGIYNDFGATVLITDSAHLADRVADELESLVAGLERQEIIRKANCCIVVAESLDQAMHLANDFAPEHLLIVTSDASRRATQVENAGAIFVGPYATVPLGDYVAGPNHTLPTAGAARFGSPLGVHTFLKRTSVLSLNRKDLELLRDACVRLAELEGLTAHAHAVEVRFE